MKPLLLSVDSVYYQKFLKWYDIDFTQVGNLYKIPGFVDHNRLIDLNAVWSTHPRGEPVDRTQTIAAPSNYQVIRPWRKPISCYSLEQVFEHRVKYYCNQHNKINLFWSGGIDSTSMVVGFLNHCNHLDQIRVIYSPFSVYENRPFMDFLRKNFPTLEMLDISGDVYLTTQLDGVVVTGHGADEFTGSLDESFVDKVGIDGLSQPWRDYITPDLVDFCEQYFALAGRPIETVLEARWWYYAITKSQVFPVTVNSFMNNTTDATDSGFFNCNEFEDYMYFNTDKLIGDTYTTYKQFLKQYIYMFDGNQDFLHNGRKVNSIQMPLYQIKMMALQNQYWIFKLSDNTIVRTKNLPFLSQLEFRNEHGQNFDYLFNFINHA
jgi:hypothetical protein